MRRASKPLREGFFLVFSIFGGRSRVYIYMNTLYYVAASRKGNEVVVVEMDAPAERVTVRTADGFLYDAILHPTKFGFAVVCGLTGMRWSYSDARHTDNPRKSAVLLARKAVAEITREQYFDRVKRLRFQFPAIATLATDNATALATLPRYVGGAPMK
jgi:hypothetical protein